MDKNRLLTVVLTLVMSCMINISFAQNNPFEITDRLELLPIESISPQDSSKYVNNSTSQKLKSDKSESNPFEVSHIPLRKKDFIDQNKVKTTVVKKNFLENSFPLFMIILSIILIAILLSQNRKLITELSNSLLNMTSLNTLQRKYQNGWSIMSMMLYSIFIINISLFINRAAGLDTLRNFIYVTCSISIIYLVKHALVRASGFIFPIHDLIKKINFSVISLHALLGIILVPINIFLYFSYDALSEAFLYIGIIAIVLNFLFRWLKGLFFGSVVLSSQPFHFFIYLCSFEILPWLVGWKILSSGTYF